MNICIIDDNLEQLNITKSLMEDFLQKNDVKYNMEAHLDPNNILDDVNSIDMLILDIEIENLNGIEFAKEVRKINKDIKIIFVSNYTEYLVDGYKVHADRYFLKPINKIEFEYEMKDVLKDCIMRSRFIYDKNICNQKIYVNEILYVEILNRKTILHLSNDREYYYPYSLKWWEDYLSDFCFVQPHRAYLINMYNIASYNNDSITLFSNEKVPLSKKYKNTFEKTYFKFLNSIR